MKHWKYARNPGDNPHLRYKKHKLAALVYLHLGNVEMHVRKLIHAANTEEHNPQILNN